MKKLIWLVAVMAVTLLGCPPDDGSGPTPMGQPSGGSDGAGGAGGGG